MDENSRAARRRAEREETKRLEQLNGYLKTGLLPLIRQYGWAVQYVAPAVDGEEILSLPFTYTVGLAGFDLPELITYALPPDVSKAVLNSIATDLRDGKKVLAQGHLLDGYTQGYPLAVVEVTDPDAPLTMARYLYEKDDKPLRAFQLVWQDLEHRFPWDDGFDSGLPLEVPLLGEWK